MNESTDQILGLTAQIVSAHVQHNTVAPDALPRLIQDVYRTLLNVGKQAAPVEKPTPAVFAARRTTLAKSKKLSREMKWFGRRMSLHSR